MEKFIAQLHHVTHGEWRNTASIQVSSNQPA